MQRSNVAEITNYDSALQSGERMAPMAGSADFRDLWRILTCRRRLILAVVLFCSIGTVLYILLARSQFTATAQILIDPRDRQIVTKDVNPDTLAPDGGVIQVESQSKVIESDAVLLRAIRALNLANDEDYGAHKNGILYRLFEIVTGVEETAGPTANENRALRALRKHLVVKRADKVFVVDIVVTAYSGAKAASIADAIAEAYLADQIKSRSESSSRASEALASRLTELRHSVETSAEAVERFKNSHDLLGTDKQLISDQQLNDNGTQVNNARAKVAEFKARVDQLDALRRSHTDDGAMQEAIQSTVITQLRASQSELMRRRSDMGTRLGDRHPDLIALDAEINQTRVLISAELDRLIRSAHADLDRARKNEEALSSNQQALKQQTISSNQAFVTLQELVRELDARRSVYQAFLARAGETKEQSSIDNTNARIISRAIPPVQPSWPLRAILLLGAIGGGLGLGAAMAFFAEYLAPTILSASQLEAAAGVPVVGMIPNRSRSILAAFRPAARKGGTSPARDVALRLALSRLCGPLTFLKYNSDPRTLLLVQARALPSAPEHFGLELARAAAQAHASVLIVETGLDMAARDAPSAGFLNVLNGECDLKSTISRDAMPGVFRLGLGWQNSGAHEIVTPERLGAFIKMAGRKLDLIMAGVKLDLIVFNAAPYGEGVRAASLAASVDSVLFVARRGETSQREVVETADAVAASAGRTLSAALMVDRLEWV